MKNKEISKKREKSIGKQINGRAHIRSGGLWFRKGDASNEHFLVEDKFTNKEKYSVKIDLLNKIEKEALQVNKIPVFRFGFEKEKRDFVLMRNTDYFYYPKYMPPRLIITNRKSITLYCKDLVNLFIKENSQSECIYFSKYNKSYILITWKEFLNFYKHVSGEEK